MHNMNKKELFNFISQVSFMLDDITLFLNTHPDCADAIDAYNEFKEIRREAVCDYTANYGPLNRYDVNACNYWDWVNKPWPWEGECGC
ncbi:MAG: spore coat protein CotJB [Clostridium sp.]|nr:spore coat protein CotJB [Clostridium sp.]MCM1172267.1 spore coat protein CotJB [Clostridium sp.]